VESKELLNIKQLPALKKILVIGNGGRENSLAWALEKCSETEEVFVAPGNGGTENHKGCKRLNIHPDQTFDLIESCKSKQIDLVVIGPEGPLASGLADSLRDKGIIVFGPCANGAKLEASKKWAKELMHGAMVPTAKYWAVNNKDDALAILKKVNTPLVVKADGLASGKGVVVPKTLEETIEAINNSFDGKFGSAGYEIVLEEKINGPEVSVFAICDGNQFILLPPAQDHKRLLEGDLGPNTGGMGAYAPAKLLGEEDLENIGKLIIKPTLIELNKRGIDYRGVIYAGLMLTKTGPKVIEFNCRFGDPECQALMPLMGEEFGKTLQACASGDLSKSSDLKIVNSYSACIVAASKGYPEKPELGYEINIDLKKDPTLQIFQAGTELNSNNKLVTSGGRVLSVVGYDDNFDKAFEKAYKAIKQIHFTGIKYRKDIGSQVRQS